MTKKEIKDIESLIDSIKYIQDYKIISAEEYESFVKTGIKSLSEENIKLKRKVKSLEDTISAYKLNNENLRNISDKNKFENTSLKKEVDFYKTALIMIYMICITVAIVRWLW